MSQQLPEDQVRAINDAILAGRKIEAIKLYREAVGCDLKTAKAAVELFGTVFHDQQPEQFQAPARRKGCGASSAAALLLAVAVYACLRLLNL